jgi:muconate/chloromuconate cycloisomerase
MKIERIETILVDVPTRRPHKLAFATVQAQNYVVVKVHSGGLFGIGEAATIGGPRWGDESTEAIKANIDQYIAPVLIGEDATQLNLIEQRLARSVAGNAFARAAVGMAIYDLVARSKQQSVAELMGGPVERAIELAWTLASGDTARDVEEGEEMLRRRLHRHFKVKVGAGDPARDVAHVIKLAKAFAGRATIRIDVNQGWDEHTARRFLSPLEQAGVALVEQPLPRWNVAGMARLKTSTAMSVMADEGVASSHDAIAHVQAAAADTFALKVTKSGGYAETRRIAAIAAGAGLALYGGCMLETGIGTAAYLQLFATLPSMKWGCELFGPRLLENDIVTSPPAMKDFAIHLPDSYGTGVEIDEDKLNFYRRDRSRSAQAKA